jgi:peptidoglycan DL-endopeptidase CwlO
MTRHAIAPATRSARDAPRDAGAVQASGAIILALGSLLVIPLLITLGLSGASQATCGQPTTSQPGLTADARTGIPTDYLRLYQAAGRQYGLPWTLLAAIGKTESDHGRDPSAGVHAGANSAGAAGPMQIGIGGAAGNNWGGTPRHPAGQATGGVGVDGNGDGWADVHDPADAIPGAARFLLAHGAPGNLPHAVFAYNPDPAYVRRVTAQATRYGTGTTPPGTNTDPDPVTCRGDVDAFTNIPGGAAATVLAYARAQIGKPYVYGAEGPDSFDCSGLTMMAYRAAHITIPRLSDGQYWHGPRIRPRTEQPGDLVFFDYKPGHTGPGHVGIVENPTPAS